MPGGGPTDTRPGRFGRVSGALRAAFGLAADVGLPPLCAACREAVASNGLCAACWSKLAFIAPPYCERLGIPFPFDPGPGVLSMEAIADPPAYRRARGSALRRYRAQARHRLQVRRPGLRRAPHVPLDVPCRSRQLGRR